MKRKLLLVGWDAADWKVIAPLIDQGHMPHTAALIERGAMGNLATLKPPLSPMLWTSIATGKRPYKHGIYGFTEPDLDNGSIRPITNLSRKTKAIWNILNQEGKKSHVVGWWPSSPAEPINGSMVSDHFYNATAPLDKSWPMPAGTVHPPELEEELSPLRIHPHELEGDMLRHFVPRAPEIDQKEDTRLMAIAKTLAECSSVHAAATHLMQKDDDWDFCAVYYDAIDHFCHGFMKYHPPRLDWVPEEDYELYKGVINAGYVYHDMMLGALIELAGPETTVILMSDHGFHPDHLRPQSLPNEPAGPASEHRDLGILVAAGPGIKKDQLVFGSTLLDITPTILSLFDLPVGRDMDGRVLSDIYEQPYTENFIDSWDAVAGDDGRHPADKQINPVESQEAMKQLVDLGYIDEPDADSRVAIDETTRELEYNLARAYLDGGKHQEAINMFEKLWERWPRESRFGTHLLQTYLTTEQIQEARETMDRLISRKQESCVAAQEEYIQLLHDTYKEQRDKGEIASPAEDSLIHKIDSLEKPEQVRCLLGHIDTKKLNKQLNYKLLRLQRQSTVNFKTFAFLEGSILHLEGKHKEAIAALEDATTIQTNQLPSVFLKMAQVHSSVHQWEDAQKNYQKVVKIDNLNAPAHYGLARVAFHQRDYSTAIDEARTCIGQIYHHAPAHYLLGLAHQKMDQHQDALDSFKAAISINPVFPAAQRSLASLHRREFSDWTAYAKHLKLARKAYHRINQQQAGITDLDQHPTEIRDSFTSEPLEQTASKDRPKVDLPPRDECVTIVTGLPRSGTSMMMQILAAGGVPALTDDHRPADASNEKGYFEFEDAKKLSLEHEWLDQADGQAVKIVAQLLPHLPRHKKYRIIMMHRSLDAVVSSQRKMLKRLGKSGAITTNKTLKKTFKTQVSKVRNVLSHYQNQGTLDFINIKYDDTLSDPLSIASQVADFLDDSSFDIPSAAAVVETRLRHECA